MPTERNTHSTAIGYILWIFGFMGAHRFFFGRPVTGTIWLFTLGLLGIGWIIDLFLIPSMSREAAPGSQPCSAARSSRAQPSSLGLGPPITDWED